MEEQAGMHNAVITNPEKRMFGIYSGFVTDHIKSKDGKIIGLSANLPLYGAVRNIMLTSDRNWQYSTPQINDEIIISFIDGLIERPVLMRCTYPYKNDRLGSDPKEYFTKMPNGVSLSISKDGSIILTTPKPDKDHNGVEINIEKSGNIMVITPDEDTSFIVNANGEVILNGKKLDIVIKNEMVISGSTIKLNNPEDSKKCVRVGDKTKGHKHKVPYHIHMTPNGPTTDITSWVPTPGKDGDTDEVKDEMNEGSETLLIGD